MNYYNTPEIKVNGYNKVKNMLISLMNIDANVVNTVSRKINQCKNNHNMTELGLSQEC